MSEASSSYGKNKRKQKSDKDRKRTLSSSSSSGSDEPERSSKALKTAGNQDARNNIDDQFAEAEKYRSKGPQNAPDTGYGHSQYKSQNQFQVPASSDRNSSSRNEYYRESSQSGNSQRRDDQYRQDVSTSKGSNSRHDNSYQDESNRSRNSSGVGSSYYHESSFGQSYSHNDSSYRPSSTPRSSNASHGEGLAPVVARHYNEIEEKGLEAREESKIVILRKYNNWAKSMNFNDAMDEFRKERRPYNSLIGLDLCCGKGGDLRKWEKSRMMKHVVFVDIAEVSLNNCKERYEEMKRKFEEQREQRGGRGLPLFDAEFFVADCTKESVQKKLSNPDMMFDIVSCQFSFHYCFESRAQANQMLQNATENLVSGGYFIGTLPNADRIVKRRRECGKNEFGNEVYKVRFECDEPYPVYGARYFFELEDAISCPEFLVHFPSLVKVARKFGLSLIYRYAFDEFHYRHTAKHDAKSLLSGMGALETYPPTRGEALHFQEQNYNHADRYIEDLKQNQPSRNWDGVKVGTISSVEWEAIKLYLAFCFKKN